MKLSQENAEMIRESVEDTVGYICTEAMNSGDPISGEAVWTIIECLAIAKQAEMRGEVTA